MPADSTTRDLGGWTPDELRATLQQFSGAGSDHDIEATIRFVRGVATVVRRRAAFDQGRDPRTLSVFLLSPDAAGRTNLAREPMLDAGQTTIAGKVWFVNEPVVSGKACALDVEDADGVFRTVTHKLRLGHLPAAIVDPRQERTQVRFYPQGLNVPDSYIPVRLTCIDVDLQQICEVIEDVYRKSLMVPDAQPRGNKLWKSQSKYRPFRNAEHKIQAYLKPVFDWAFPTCRVYEEFAGIMGRADLHLEEPDPLNRENVTFVAVLELKVLRSYSESGTAYSNSNMAKWVKDGVQQAGYYRKERGHRVAVLCCFDMRKADSGSQCFDAVTGLAGELKVALRRWYLYASSELARDAGAFTTVPPA